MTEFKNQFIHVYIDSSNRTFHQSPLDFVNKPVILLILHLFYDGGFEYAALSTTVSTVNILFDNFDSSQDHLCCVIDCNFAFQMSSSLFEEPLYSRKFPLLLPLFCFVFSSLFTICILLMYRQLQLVSSETYSFFAYFVPKSNQKSNIACQSSLSIRFWRGVSMSVCVCWVLNKVQLVFVWLGFFQVLVFWGKIDVCAKNTLQQWRALKSLPKGFVFVSVWV